MAWDKSKVKHEPFKWDTEETIATVDINDYKRNLYKLVSLKTFRLMVIESQSKKKEDSTWKTSKSKSISFNGKAYNELKRVLKEQEEKIEKYLFEKRTQEGPTVSVKKEDKSPSLKTELDNAGVKPVPLTTAKDPVKDQFDFEL